MSVTPGTPAAVRPWPARGLRAAWWLVLALLLAVSAASWVSLVRQSDGGSMVPSLLPGGSTASMDGMEGMRGMEGTAGMGMSVGVAMFLAMWVTMMVAMMFPAVAPKAVGYWRISTRRAQGLPAPALFLLGYLVVWSAVGLVAYGAYRLLLEAVGSLSSDARSLAAGTALVAAGTYQFSGAKSVCLRRCRGLFDLAFSFRPGLAGAVRMGTGHGLWCLGCCWALMVVLFVLGLMNLVWMGVMAVVIFLEKLGPRPNLMTKVVGLALVAAGALVAGSAVFG